MKDEAIIAAIALSLYSYNVSVAARARAIHDHFKGACMEMSDLEHALAGPHAMTELPFPSAEIYLQHAMDRYGEEAAIRVRVERGGLFHE